MGRVGGLGACGWAGSAALELRMGRVGGWGWAAGVGLGGSPGPRRGPAWTRGSSWRWRWDLNPRWACTHTRFRGVLLRPLGHATADEGTGPAPGGARHRRSRRPRWPAKNSSSSAADSSASTPPTTSGRWLSRRSRTTSHSDPTAPAFGVVGAEHQPVHAGQHDGAGAHRARLEGDDQGAAVQPPAAAGARPPRAGPRPRRARSGRRRPRGGCGRGRATAPAASSTTRPDGHVVRGRARRRASSRASAHRGDPGAGAGSQVVLSADRARRTAAPKPELGRRCRRASRRGRGRSRRAARPCPWRASPRSATMPRSPAGSLVVLVVGQRELEVLTTDARDRPVGGGGDVGEQQPDVRRRHPDAARRSPRRPTPARAPRRRRGSGAARRRASSRSAATSSSSSSTRQTPSSR